MIRRCRPDDIGVSVSYPLPGTAFYERVKVQLGEKQNWVDSDELAMMYRATYVPEFYRTLHAAIHAEFRARRSVAALGTVVRRPWKLRRRTAHDIVGGACQAIRLPVLRRELTRLSRKTQSTPSIVLHPVLSQQAAARPSEQPQ
jgi:hypothetical protein